MSRFNFHYRPPKEDEFYQEQQQVQAQVLVDPQEIITINIDEAMIRETNEVSKILETDLVALMEIQNTTTELLGEMRDEITTIIPGDIARCDGMTNGTVYTLAEAGHTNGAKHMVVGAAIGAVVGGVAGAAIGGAATHGAGVLITAAAGAGVGAAVGAGAGKLVAIDQNRTIEKELVNLVHARTWIADSDAPLCMRCDAAFNPITNRRHHCRKCGGVFCGKCCSSKQYLQYEGVKHLKKMRVCDGCITKPAVPADRRIDLREHAAKKKQKNGYRLEDSVY